MFATFTFDGGGKEVTIYINPDHVVSFSSSDPRLTAILLSNGSTQIVSQTAAEVAGRLTTVKNGYR